MARKKTTPKRKKTRKPRKRAARLLAALGLYGFAAGMLVLAWLGWGLPRIGDVKPLDIRPGLSIMAADGSLIARYGGMRGENVALSDLPAYVPHAFIAIEDRRFYDHFGIDPRGLARAMLANAKAMAWVQGGSTITQQLAKNLFLTPDKTLRRKGQEALMALVIERRFSKDDILEAYLNRVYFGAGAYGLEAAARTYFAKPARDLTLWESAVLAGLLKAPSRYSPLANPDRALARARVVMAAMRRAGYITPDMERNELQDARIHVVGSTHEDPARHFTDWVVAQMDDYLDGASSPLVVHTTLHPGLQALAEEKARAFLAAVPAEDKVSELALVTLAKDGAVLAMIGGADYSKSQFNRATMALRQPGSAFKPFVYLAALETGYGPRDKILDAPFDAGDYRPANYGGQYHGEVTLAEALAFSLNTATIRLLQSVGVGKLLDVAARAGITQDLRPELATGLGAGEVSLIELAGAYAVIGNGGRAAWPYAVTRIEDAHGNVFYRREEGAPPQVFSTRDMADLDRMLAGVVQRGTGRAARLPHGHAAGKTGTSQDYRDAWFVGYSDRLVTGIWMGNDDASPMHGVTGGGHPARLWGDYMATAVTMDGDVPVLRRNIFEDGADAFSRMLNRWSNGGRDGGGFVPDNRPRYNK